MKGGWLTLFGLGAAALALFSMMAAHAASAPGGGGVAKSGLLPDGRLDPAFEKRARQIAQRIGLPFSWLMAVMFFETGGTFRSDIPNAAGSGAVGLIQFMPQTARQMGTSSEALAKMSALEQLEWVDKFYGSHNFSGSDPRDGYLAVFYPGALGKPDSWELPSRVYEQNKGLDRDRNGIITAGEIRATIEGAHGQVVKRGWV